MTYFRWFVVALVACTPGRPKGAYESVYPDGGRNCAPRPGIPFPCGQPEGGDIVDTDDDDDTLDVDVERDAGIDAVIIDPGNPLSALQGSYLMRIDYYSTAVGTESGYTLRVKNRVSNLFFVTFAPGEGVLNAEEQLCVQDSSHKCLDGCDEWSTMYDTGLPAKYREKSLVRRPWAIDSGSRVLTVKADNALLALGFDPIDSPSKLPADIKASNVWQTGEASVTRGVHTYLSGYLNLPLVGRTLLDCHLNSLMVFGTAFGGTLPNLENGLDGFVATVDSAGSAAKAADSSGGPPAFCDHTKLSSDGMETDSKIVVRMMRTSRASCPGDYEAAFPLPAGKDLDP